MALMPPLAPIVVLLFLGALGATMLAAAALVYALARARPKLMARAALLLVLIPAAYASALLADSLKSRDLVLPLGAKKYFCEIDCHLACSVLHVERAKTLGTERAAGTFLVVTLRTWFDESTISPRRPRDAALTPNPRQVYVADASGRRFPVSEPGQRALAQAGATSTPLSRALIPGESYRTLLVFDLPDDAPKPRPFVGDADPIAALLLFHEQSPLHRKIWFEL